MQTKYLQNDPIVSLARSDGGAASTMFGITAAGKLVAVGYRGPENGAVGTEEGSTITQVEAPVALTNASSISLSSSPTGSHILAVADGQLFAWGNGLYGQCMHEFKLTILVCTGKLALQLTPLQISTGALQNSVIKSAAAGERHSLILTSDNRLYSCGENAYGQLVSNFCNNFVR